MHIYQPPRGGVHTLVVGSVLDVKVLESTVEATVDKTI